MQADAPTALLEGLFETKNRYGERCWCGAYSYPDLELWGRIDTYTPCFPTSDAVFAWFESRFAAQAA